MISSVMPVHTHKLPFWINIPHVETTMMKQKYIIILPVLFGVLGWHNCFCVSIVVITNVLEFDYECIPLCMIIFIV